MIRLIILLMLVTSSPVFAQDRSSIVNRTRDSKSRTFKRTVIFAELILEGSGIGLEGRSWSKIFRDEKISFRMRRARSRDKIETREIKMGTIRKVTLIGKIEANGRLIFDGHKFNPGESEKLIDWLDEIRKYGAQGSPGGKQLWGLNEKQFNAVFKSLSVPLAQNIKGKTFTDSLKAFELPSSVPHFVSQDAKDWLSENQLHILKMPQEVKGISKGTALAYMLGRYGLAGYPLRMSDGSVRFQIEPRKQGPIYWPIGWDLKKSNIQAAPSLFQFRTEELEEEIPVIDALEAISAKSRVPILLDYYNMEMHGIDLSEKMFSHRRQKMALMTLIKRATTPQFLKAELKVDERGRPLIWARCIKRPKKK